MGDATDQVSHIFHEAWDQPAAASVILVHGALDRGMAFRKVVQQLNAYDTTVYDRRGYGASVNLGPATSMDQHLDDLLGLMGEKPAVLIGHSFGGLVALLAAARHPDRVAALGLYEPPVPGTEIEPEPDPADIPPEDPNEAVPWFYNRMGDTAWDQIPARAQQALLAEGPAFLGDIRAARAMRDAGPILDPADITTPAIVAHGAQSESRHVERSVALAEHLPNGSLHIVPDAGHPGHRTHPQHFVAFVQETIALQLG